MGRKIWSGVGVGAGVFAGVMGAMVTTWAVSGGEPLKSPTGLPLNGPIAKSTPLPVLTRDQLITRGHADDKLEIEGLLHAYQFFHDTHNAEGVASLFVKDGMFEHLYNADGKSIEPLPGPNGRGCAKYAPDDILKMYANAIPLPTVVHNQVTNTLVQVYGDTATAYCNVVMTRSNKSGAKPIVEGQYSALMDHTSENIADFRKTADGWRITHLRVIQDFKEPGADADPPCPATATH
jgi:hypothetical protein